MRCKKTARIPPTAQQLRAMLHKHISFEINRFRAAAALWGSTKYGREEDAMIRESCLIHFRLLLDFFYPRISPGRSRYKDVFASDFFSEGPPPELRRAPEWLREYRDQLDWRLAHLTLKRLEFEERPHWDPAAQFAHMQSTIELFLAALPEEQREWFNADQR